MANDGGWLTLRAAAEQLGCSVETLRRRIKKGDLAARQVDTPRGVVWQVQAGTALARTRSGATSLVGVVEQRPPPQTDHSPVMIELVHLVHDLTSRNEALVFEAAELRAELRFARECIRQLEQGGQS